MVNYIYLLIPPINERDFGDPMISRWHHRLSQTCPTWSCCREAKQKNGPGAWSLQPSGSHFLRYTLGNGNLRCDFQPTLRPARSQQKSAFFPRKSSSAFSRRCTSVTICGRAHVLREIEVIPSSGRSGCSGQSKALLTSLYGTIPPFAASRAAQGLQGMWWSTTKLYFQPKYTKSLEDGHEQFEDLEGHEPCWEPVDQALVTGIGLRTVQYHSLAFMAHSFPKQ